MRASFRALLNLTSHSSSSSSSVCAVRSSSSFSTPQQKEKDQMITRLCKENKFNDALQILCKQRRLKEAIQLLERREIRPSATVFSTLLRICIENRALDEGKRVHKSMKCSGFRPGVVISNRILDFYCKCDKPFDAHKLFVEMPERDLCSWNIMVSGFAKLGLIDEARKVFDEMPERDNFSWTAMISGYVRCNKPECALELYGVMQRDENLKCNKFTISSALAASASIQSLRLGKEIHGHIVRTGLDSDAVVWSALSDMYGKCGSVDEARHIFDRTNDKDIVSWTAMIDRYFGDGRWEEGYLLFSCLMESGIRPNDFTFAGVLNACAHQTIEHMGKQVHGYMMRIGFDPCSFAASTLVHMYAKCGNLDSAYKVFKWLPRPDVVSWTSLINGYAQNGQPREALHLFDLLLKSGTKPDHITFVGVLSACTHAGLVDEGLEYFYSIKDKHCLTHTADHYACVVDLLSRFGRFKEAKEIISQMPMKPDKFLWASLLGGCRVHGNVELAKRAAEALFEIEPENAATYVTIGNIYATAGKWTEVAKIRQVMEEKGVVKKPGVSWINLQRKDHVFLVGDRSHPRSKEIYDFLGELWRRMKEEGYVPDIDNVLHDVEEEQKEQNLSYHSEKLAVAFGIIATPPGTQIKELPLFAPLVTRIDNLPRSSHLFASLVTRTDNLKDGGQEVGVTEFMEGLSLLTSPKHENLLKLRESYDHQGIAKGLGYQHSSEPDKPSTVHCNISVEKVLLDQQFTPLILDCGLLKLLVDDVVYPALKVSAALGYMAPEYITTGRFTEKSDVYAFGVIILQVLSGKGLVDCSMRHAAESCNFENFIDPNLRGTFSLSEATMLTKLAISCTLEDPDGTPKYGPGK
ncbi:Pentatricopeptide repeat-containing protein [Capsicum annuum]|nr:Pentatricopeptide repeat-containing protein [Capsicum annuum]